VTVEAPPVDPELQDLSYAISHDLAAPLRAISSFATIIAETYGPAVDEDGRHLLSVVRSESEKLGTMIESLARYCRVGTQPMRHVAIEMEPLARESATRQAERYGCALASVSIAGLPAAAGDPELLGEVWDELIGNAIKFSSRQSAPSIEVYGDLVGAEAVYRIKDNGAGFDAERANGLFQLFRRFHRPDEFAGVGVGLALARRVLLRHGGRIRVDSQSDRGAVCEFSLPAGP
jgi:light-regulated signal transduction histidine kinase (bacteriophytochrome)